MTLIEAGGKRAQLCRPLRVFRVVVQEHPVLGSSRSGMIAGLAHCFDELKAKAPGGMGEVYKARDTRRRVHLLIVGKVSSQ